MQGNRTARLGALAVVLLGLGAWMLLRDPSSPTEPGPTDATTKRHADTPSSPRRASVAEHPAAIDRPSSTSAKLEAARRKRAKRDELRSKILAALATRSPAPRPSAPADPVAKHDQPAPAGALNDRMGGREALLKSLNHDFMPLADECIAEARARLPGLDGMLAIGLETVADDELGGVVESVTMQPDNQIDDPALLECMQETALSTILPPPPDSGREQFVLTIPIEPD